ncbi:hypothetical protein ANCCEY_08955 [Ancylostoma ceylanicum]|uniref:PDZ domain-containing protein n=1 Tax=Ancylostoma ceylanicum TaxID=53326 RepID=A0A0D6LPM8_9BILA|nr:hypothetical protein ANCCEY_08955 [Ancylostoma ceylanicum]
MRETKAFWLLAIQPTIAMADTCLSQPQLVGVVFGSVGATLAICIGIAAVFWIVLRRKVVNRHVDVILNALLEVAYLRINALHHPPAFHERARSHDAAARGKKKCLKRRGLPLGWKKRLADGNFEKPEEVEMSMRNWLFMQPVPPYRRHIGTKTIEAAVYTNGDIEGKHCGTQAKVSQKDQVTMIDSFKLPRKFLDTGTQKSFSVENVNEASGKVGVLLKSEDAAGFGMTIQGNMNEGIYVKEVVPMGAADQTGNILPGDRIKTLSICFDNMVYEDALTLLSYASPYRVKFELERKIETPPPMDDEIGYTAPSRASPDELSKKPERATSPSDDKNAPANAQKSDDIELVEQKTEQSLVNAVPSEPLLTKVISEVADSTTIDTDLSKMESSDYASDNTSEYRESESDYGNGSQLMLSPQNSQHTISDRIEITDVIADKPMASPTPLPPRVEYCKSLPPKSKPIVSRKPYGPSELTSPPLCSASPSPKLRIVTKTPSPVPPIKEEIHERERPIVERAPSPKKTRIPSAPSMRALDSPQGAPEFTEARTSRIPKRNDSIKTPIIERKLPQLPKSVTQRSHSSEDKERGDVWSRLYMDKKATLRKTRETDTPVRRTGELEITSTITSPLPSPKPSRPSTATDLRFGTLDRERRERLAANQDVLDRQTEELRKLGVL